MGGPVRGVAEGVAIHLSGEAGQIEGVAGGERAILVIS